MFKTLKMKIASRKLARKKTSKKNNAKSSSRLWTKIKQIIAYPFLLVTKGARAFWNWVRCIDLIGLVNLTLLSAIIVLFSMLIVDLVNANKKTVVIVAKQNIPEQNIPTPTLPNNNLNNTKTTLATTPALPIKREPETRKFVAKPVSVVAVKVCETTVKQTAKVNNTMYGDVIIDSRGAGKMLKSGDVIKGNLYLQNMRKYILPCNTVIDGNLFLRDVNMLQFCGDFTVTGNIYVNPTSSFGPLPKTARVGGQIII